MAYQHHRRSPSPSSYSSLHSLSDQLVDMAKPLAKPWLKLKGIMGDDSSRKDLMKRMQHRTGSSAHLHHASPPSGLGSSPDNNYYYSMTPSPHSNINSPTGSQRSLHVHNNNDSPVLYGTTSPKHRGSNSSGIGLSELVSDFAGGGAVNVPTFFIPPTRFNNDSARSSIGGGATSSSTQNSSPIIVTSTSSSKKWHKLRLISSVAVRPSQANERRSSVDTRGRQQNSNSNTNNIPPDGSGGGGGHGVDSMQHRHHDKLRKLRQRPTQFELQVPSLATRSQTAASSSSDVTSTAVPISGMMYRSGGSHGGTAFSGPNSRISSPKKLPVSRPSVGRVQSPVKYFQHTPASPARYLHNMQPPPISIVSESQPMPAPTISINDEYSSDYSHPRPSSSTHTNHASETNRKTSSTSSTGSATKQLSVEPEDDSAFLGVNTSDSRMRRQSCESKYWDCPEAPAPSLMLKIPQRDTMYQRRRSSTYCNLNDLLNGVDTAAAAAGADATNNTNNNKQAANNPTTPTKTRTSSSASPSNSPGAARRRPTQAQLLTEANTSSNSRPSSGGSTTAQQPQNSRPGSGMSSTSTSAAGPGNGNNNGSVRVRTRHLSVTHVSSSDILTNSGRVQQHQRHQSISPHQRKDSTAVGGGGGTLNANGRQMSVSAENLADTSLLADDNALALERAESQAIATRGEVKLALIYLHEEKTLKATVFRAENLGKTRRDISSFVAACLLPGKEQIQKSRLIKSNKNPQYNEEFYFPGHRWQELTAMILRISIYNELTVGKECLGEVLIPLGTLDVPTVEQRMWRDLRPKLQNPMQDNAFIQLRLCFNTSVRKAIVTVMKVHNVRGAVTFLPDVYVKAELWQNHKQMDKRSTKVVKRTNNPVFKEAFAFHLNMTKEEMSFTTIKVTLVAKAAIGSDGPIGQVILGYGATEDTENEQWRHAVRDPGKEFTRWHALLPVD